MLDKSGLLAKGWKRHCGTSRSSTGDRIIFTANVDEYKGRTRTGYGYRFGLKPKKVMGMWDSL